MKTLNRREFMRLLGASGLLFGLRSLAPAYAAPAGSGSVLNVKPEGVDLEIRETPFEVAGRIGHALTVNGTVPGPLLRFREGESAVLRVTNHLDELTTIHWHGLLVPPGMDGVAGLSFSGIAPGETFTYEFDVRQNGTYWYHSHQGLQEQLGHYGPLIIDPQEPDPFDYDRDYVVFLSDWTFENPYEVLEHLKKQADYYNFQQRTIEDLVKDIREHGWSATLDDRLAWARMRMSPTDIMDVTGYTYTFLVNGLAPEDNWTGLFRPGEKVRLRFINGAAGTFFNVRIPGLPMTVVQADGQNVQSVTIDEFQIAVAETYDVIVEPQADKAYTIFTESMDRSGFGRGTLAPRPGMTASIPALRERPLRSMVDMGMSMGAMDMQEMKTPGAVGTSKEAHGKHAAVPHPESEAHNAMPGGEHAGAMLGMEKAGPVVARHGPDTHGPANASVATVQRYRLGERGTGLEDVDHRVLVYTDLESLTPTSDPRPPGREIEIHLTGNMEAFMWGFDGKKFSELDEPIYLDYGERVRFTLVNDTMMEHPMHLHGVFMEIENGAGAYKPRKHTISVKAAERLSFDVTADEPGNWAFHCHLLYHMDAGMMHAVNIGLPQREGE
ncbi:copper resistance system multicopper oxidase [Gilvimarinus sp. F26214L]|uniref:copper resistance system multicopper oxidase n=1 Tax=Gilvimarinus sp. DZF01 TaxID=3461371 RepID=UPI00404683ED